jgi:hypothetical protein
LQKLPVTLGYFQLCWPFHSCSFRSQISYGAHLYKINAPKKITFITLFYSIEECLNCQKVVS